MSELLLDLVLAGLLVCTAVWCALLHQRLRRLRTERGEMEAFIGALAGASERAEAALGGIRQAAAESAAKLREASEAAQQRSGELARLIENGGRLARRLEVDVDQAARTMAAAGAVRETAPERPARRDVAPPAREPAVGTAERATRGAGKETRAEELLRALESLR